MHRARPVVSNPGGVSDCALFALPGGRRPVCPDVRLAGQVLLRQLFNGEQT
jgi:hypothetical protein